jgi:antitoxin (DNA-binding transcriptional repressor) of toxin-antitoxin stability system
VYKIEVSPLDQRNSGNYDKPKIVRGTRAGKNAKNAVPEGEEPVSMLQYDKTVADLVPVNAKKVQHGDSRSSVSARSVDREESEEPEERAEPVHKKKRKHRSSTTDEYQDQRYITNDQQSNQSQGNRSYAFGNQPHSNQSQTPYYY